MTSAAANCHTDRGCSFIPPSRLEEDLLMMRIGLQGPRREAKGARGAKGVAR